MVIRATRRRALRLTLMLGIALLALPTSSALAGRFWATGHDADYHCTGDEQCHYLQTAVDFVRAGAPDPGKKVLVLDNSGNEVADALSNAYGASAPAIDQVDPQSPEFLTTPIDVSHYSAIIVASDTTCGGCDLNTYDSTPDSDAINSRAADIASFFNAGGGILALAGAEHGNGSEADDVYYDFLPLPVGGEPVSEPFTLASDGIALGLENPDQGVGTHDDVNCCATHNSFTDPPAGSAIKVAERDSEGQAETLFVSTGAISGGKVYSLTLDPSDATNNVGDPHTVTAHLSSNEGPESGKSVLFKVAGANAQGPVSKTTGADGSATFTYTGTNAGNDTITACYDANGNNACDADEATATAHKTYVGEGGGGESSGRMTGRAVLYDGRNNYDNNHGLRVYLSGADDRARNRTPLNLPCDVADGGADLKVQWGFKNKPRDNQFVLTSLTDASCIGNKWIGTGEGTLNGVTGATIQLTLIDKGSPGTRNDRGDIQILDASNAPALVKPNRFIGDGNLRALFGDGSV